MAVRMPVAIRPARSGELAQVIAIDDDASTMYEAAGLALGLTDDHPFVVAERRRWARALAAGGIFFAERQAGRPVGVVVLDCLDGAPYLDQLSVRREAMGQGIGRALLAYAMEWARTRGGGLSLTTYDHVPWDRPFYQRADFVLVPEEQWGPEMRAIVDDQRAALPDPHARVVMHRP